MLAVDLTSAYILISMKNNQVYKIDQLAKLAGVSVRTLRYYDQLGLLKPVDRTNGNQRLYNYQQLLILQQILFYKELGFELKKISEILHAKNFDLVNALEEHKNSLTHKLQNMQTLINTINNTILHLKKNKMLDDDELYEGFSKDEVAGIKAEAEAKYGDTYRESVQKVKKLSKQQWQAIQKEGGDIYVGLAKLMDTHKPDDVKVQALIKKHYQHLHHFYTPTMEMYKGLGELYVQDARFTAFFDKIQLGLAVFINKAIGEFCKRS